MEQPPEQLLRFARGAMGLDPDWTAMGSRSHQARVWLLSYENEPLAIMKYHRHLDAAVRESQFYESWARALTGRVPRWFGRCPREPRALLLGVVDGQAVSGDGTPSIQLKAGRFLGTLHSVAFLDHDELDLKDALRRRFEHGLESARPVIDGALLSEIRLPNLESIRLHRVPCHRDFGPHNWLVRDSDNRFSVIDFGQARPDVFLADLIKLVPIWTRSEAQRCAFFEGYNRRLSLPEWQLLRSLVGHYAIGSLRWGRRNADADALTEGEDMLNIFQDHDWWAQRDCV